MHVESPQSNELRFRPGPKLRCKCSLAEGAELSMLNFLSQGSFVEFLVFLSWEFVQVVWFIGHHSAAASY